MSLYHMNYNRKIRPTTLEKNTYIDLAKKRLNKRSFDKMVQLLDDALVLESPSEKTSLTWTRLSKVLGFNSQAVTVGDSNYLWDKAFEMAKGHEKTAKILLGCMFQWRVANDSRPWIAAVQDSDKLNEDGELITYTSYWIRP